jgi:hypothetical protein
LGSFGGRKLEKHTVVSEPGHDFLMCMVGYHRLVPRIQACIF